MSSARRSTAWSVNRARLAGSWLHAFGSGFRYARTQDVTTSPKRKSLPPIETATSRTGCSRAYSSSCRAWPGTPAASEKSRPGLATPFGVRKESVRAPEQARFSLSVPGSPRWISAERERWHLGTRSAVRPASS